MTYLWTTSARKLRVCDVVEYLMQQRIVDHDVRNGNVGTVCRYDKELSAC